MRNQAPLIAVAVLAALLVGAMLTLLASDTSDDQLLMGTWEATVHHVDGTVEQTTIVLPGTFRAAGIAPDSLVVAERTLRLPPSTEPWAVNLDFVRYAAAVYWDDELQTSRGNPEIPGSDVQRHEGPVLAILPPDPTGGPHTLRLELRGLHERGGITGRLRLAPAEHIFLERWNEGGMRLGFALTFGLVGLIHLIGAAMRPGSQSAHVWFGLFAVAVAAYCFDHGSSGFFSSGRPFLHHTLRRVYVSAMLGFGIAFIAQFNHGTLRPIDRAVVGYFLALAVPALGGFWLGQIVEFVQDLSLVLLALPWVIWATVSGVRRGVWGSRWLVGALFLVVLGSLNEVLVTQGFMGGPRLLFPSLTALLLFGTTAVARHDQALSDRHRQLIASTEDAMTEVRPDGTLTQLNRSARQALSGLSVGDSLLDAVEPDHRPLVLAHLARASLAANRCEFRLQNGRVVESVATSVDADSRLLVLRDVTRRRRAEGDLLTAARVETAGVLLGGVAHDFNNLLGTLLGHVGLLKLQAAPEGPVFTRLTDMESAIERASGITRRLLAVGGRSHGPITDVVVADLMGEVYILAAPSMPPGPAFHLQVDIQDDLPTVRCSAEDLRHVLLNLLINARDAVGPSGTVLLSAAVQGDNVEIAVSDDGAGVPPELRDEIWRPFFTTKGPDRGTGLGLPMARRLVRQCGGDLQLQPGMPTRFIVSLPSGGGELRPIRHQGGADIAVVDDEEVMRSDISAALEAAGYSVRAFADADTALHQLVVHPPDALITDVVMPGLSGLELAMALRELSPALPVIIVSGFIPPGEPLMPNGHTTQLDKPVRSKVVLEALGRLLETSKGDS